MFKNTLICFCLFIFICLSSTLYSKPPYSTEELLYTTLRITSKVATRNIGNNNVPIYTTNIGTGYVFDFVGKSQTISPYSYNNFPSLQDVKNPYLITNKHVIKDAEIGELTFNLSQDGSSPSGVYNVKIGDQDSPFYTKFLLHPSDQVDLCAYPLSGVINFIEGNINNESEKQYQEKYNNYLIEYKNLTKKHSYGVGAPYLQPPTKPSETKVFYRSLSKENLVDFSREEAIQDIMMVGYPLGMADEENNLPIVRKGITASHIRSNFQGKNEVLIDSAVFPGSSGSPVFLCQSSRSNIFRTKLLGTAYAIPEYTASGHVKCDNTHMKCLPIPTIHTETNIPSNLGFVIKATELEYLFQK